MHKQQRIGRAWGLWLCGVLLFVQMACGGGTAECINEIQLSEYNTSGLRCTKACDCSNLKYEGYCINGLCIASPRNPAQRKGETRLCKLLQKVGSCEWGQQEAQPTPLKELLWGDCKSEKLGPTFPENTKERCLDGIDNDCDGRLDLGDAKCSDFCFPKQISPCYTAEAKTVNLGPCRAGLKICKDDNTWGPCEGEKAPTKEVCNKEDDDCNGLIDDGLSGCSTTQSCQEGEQRRCYPDTVGCSVEVDTQGVLRFRCQGICHAGFQTCRQGAWGACEQTTRPAAELCDGIDNNCNGQIDEGCPCEDGKEQACSRGPENKTVGECIAGKQRCLNGKWGDCDGAKAPSIEVCDGKDNDCNGQIDDLCACVKDAECAQGLSCLAGICRKSECPSGQLLCAGRCVDPKTTEAHCGACGNACDTGKTCQAGVCKCPSGQADCGGSCFDTTSNGKHCGGCDKACGAQEVCASGKCGLDCPAGQAICDGGCVNLKESSLHCGSCGVSCTGGRTCNNGACQCPSGTSFCDGSCVDLNTSSAHCGACGSPCASPRSCVQSSCVCAGVGVFCDGACVQVASSDAHCGSCGNRCLGGKTCQSGQCACASTQTDCNGTCVDTQTSNDHCGGCGQGCTSPRSCVQGNCICSMGTTLCGSACVDLTSSKDHCGGCNRACTGTKSCVNGQCVCPTGEDDCGSGCIALASNTHCGACNNACAGGKTCQNKQCTCPSGQNDCNGVCVNTQTSDAHCGGCGIACTGGASCEAGKCEVSVSIAAGGQHTCALTDCNKLTCWGSNEKGQLGISVIPSYTAATPTAVTLPSGLNVKQVVAGRDFTCALFTDGSARCWGDNTKGQLGYGDTMPRPAPPIQAINLGLGRSAKKLSAGAYHLCALLDDYSLKCWGDNTNGQLGYGDATQRNYPLDAIAFGIGRSAKDVSAGWAQTCVILDNDTVKCWGDNYHGQLGYGDATQRNAPDVNPVNLGVGRTAKAIATGGSNTCALLDDDTLKCWGGNDKGQLGYGDTTNRTTPINLVVNVGVGRKVRSVSLSNDPNKPSACALLDDGSVKCWGHNGDGQLGYGDTTQRNAPDLNPLDLGTGRHAKHITVGWAFVCALLDDGTLKCWGNNDKAQAEFSSQNKLTQPASIGIVQIRCGGVCVSVQAQTRCGACQTACTTQEVCVDNRCKPPIRQTVVGSDHMCSLSENGNVKCWGYNNVGQLGYGDTTQRNAPDADPVNLGAGRTAKAISTGSDHTCAVLDNNAVKCWGENGDGRLGYGDTTQRKSPDANSINLGTGRTAKAIATGFAHTCAILDNNTVKCWGGNSRGELGYGDTTQRKSPDANPINLGTGRTAKAIASGTNYTCAILDNGSVKCWGRNDYGQLGYGDTTIRNAPDANLINLGTGRTAKAILGLSHTCVLLDNDTVKCWGYNGRGGLGYGDTTQRNAPDANPINLGAGRTAKAVSAGSSHTCALLDNDTVKCWGLNTSGQLGYGDTTQRNAPDVNPINLGAGRTAKAIAVGWYHTCVILDNDVVKCWGRNLRGGLGYGDTTQRNAPDLFPIRFY